MGYTRKSKYGAKKTECPYGHMHDSAKEATRCAMLHLMLRGKEIKDLELQKSYPLIPAARYAKPMKDEQAARYVADFVYFDKKLGVTVIEDCKGMRTKEYILKRKLMKQLYCQDGKTIFIET